MAMEILKIENQTSFQFWKDEWGTQKHLNKITGWIKDEFEEEFSKNQVENLIITAEMIKN